MTVGITAMGAYLPRSRLSREAIAAAHQWAFPQLKSRAVGTIAISNWDEDSVTMGFEAARQLVADRDVSAVRFCSTSLPFDDRSHATFLNEALALPADTHVSDCAASQRVASSALLAALAADSSGELIIASERRLSKPGSVQEIDRGDAAVAMLTGSDNLLAEFIAGGSINSDFVDHYRTADSEFDYVFEERWVRDEGIRKLVPQAIARVLEQAGVSVTQIGYLVSNLPPRVAAKLAQDAGLAKADIDGQLFREVGDTGSAAAMLGLAQALDSAQDGELILCVAFGQGADVLLFKAGPQSGRLSLIAPLLAGGHADDNYLRFLSHRNLIQLDWGMRAERDVRTAQSAYYRERRQISAMLGGQCRRCQTGQFPKTGACVNPDCRAIDAQDDYAFADKTGRVKSFTEDWQAYSPAPPLTYGNIEFTHGANILMQFTDTEAGALSVGDEVGMQLRIKDIDRQRGFRRYFFKAVPLGQTNG